MNKKQLEKMLSVERNEAGEIKYFHIAGSNPDLKPIYVPFDSDQAKATIYAASDYLRHRLYDHEDTQIGFHRKVKPSFDESAEMNPFRQTYAGAISINFMPDSGYHLVPKQKDFPYGWAALMVENGIYSLRQPRDEVQLAMKHNRIDALIAGYGFTVGIPAFLARPANGESVAWAEFMLEQFMTTSDEEAYAMRNERIGAKITREQLYAPIRRAKRRGGLTAKDVQNVGSATEVTMLDTNKAIPLSELGLGRYRVYDKNVPVQTFTWDGSIEAKAMVAGIVKKDFKLREIG